MDEQPKLIWAGREMLALSFAILVAGCDNDREKPPSRLQPWVELHAAALKEGRKVEEDVWPEVVIVNALHPNGRQAYACLGTQIGPRTILSAGHCAIGVPFVPTGWRFIRPRSAGRAKERFAETTIHLEYPGLTAPIGDNDVDLSVFCLTADRPLPGGYSYPQITTVTPPACNRPPLLEVRMFGRKLNGAAEDRDYVFLSLVQSAGVQAPWTTRLWATPPYGEPGDSGAPVFLGDPKGAPSNTLAGVYVHAKFDVRTGRDISNLHQRLDPAAVRNWVIRMADPTNCVAPRGAQEPLPKGTSAVPTAEVHSGASAEVPAIAGEVCDDTCQACSVCGDKSENCSTDGDDPLVDADCTDDEVATGNCLDGIGGRED
jgi:hypothetical protein